MELEKELEQGGPFGVFNGIDSVACFDQVFASRAGAERAAAGFRGRFERQGFYLSADGYRLPLASLEPDGQGGGVFVVGLAQDPDLFLDSFYGLPFREGGEA